MLQKNDNKCVSCFKQVFNLKTAENKQIIVDLVFLLIVSSRMQFCLFVFYNYKQKQIQNQFDTFQSDPKMKELVISTLN